MSDLSRPREALEWCVDRLANRGAVGLLNELTEVRRGHLRNVAACERSGRWPSSMNPEQARQAARFLWDVLGALQTGARITRMDLEALFVRSAT